jgi:alkylation response protein AidB-like acyl-CoA dehydrogenase
MKWEADTSLVDAARQLAPVILAHAQEAEQERRLSRPVLNALREAGLLRMFVPRSLGGLEATPSLARSWSKSSALTTPRPAGPWRTRWIGPISAPVSRIGGPRRSTAAARTS